MQIISVDTLNFAIRDKECDVFRLLGIDQSYFEAGSKPEMNYTSCVYLNGIKISAGGTAGYAFYVNLSGKGCRTLEDFRPDLDWTSFIHILYLSQVDFRRIDIAVDDDSGDFDVRRCVRYFEQGKIAGACRTFKYVLGSEEIFYAGSTQSEVLVRIYNKALERGYKDGLKDGKPWLRCEMQLRGSRAQQLITRWVGNWLDDSSMETLQQIYSGYLINHLRFIVEPNPGPHSDRIPTAWWWQRFCCHAEKIRFVSALGSDYNMTKCTRYLFNQAASSIKAFILANDLSPDELYEKFVDNGIQLNDEQKYMVMMFPSHKAMPFSKKLNYHEKS